MCISVLIAVTGILQAWQKEIAGHSASVTKKTKGFKMFYLANDIFKSWCTCLKGQEVEVISARDKSAIIIKCGNDRLTVSQHDITDVPPATATKVPETAIKQPISAIKFQKTEKVVPKTTVTQKSIF